MFFGGWLYPDAASFDVAGAGVELDADEFGWAAMSARVPRTTSAPAKRQCVAFWKGITSLRFRMDCASITFGPPRRLLVRIYADRGFTLTLEILNRPWINLSFAAATRSWAPSAFPAQRTRL